MSVDFLLRVFNIGVSIISLFIVMIIKMYVSSISSQLKQVNEKLYDHEGCIKFLKGKINGGS